MTAAVAALAIVVPLLGATLVMAAAPVTGWRVRDAAGVGLATATLVLCGWLATADGLLVSWLGGWQPVDGRAIGIALAVDPLGAGLGALAALLTAAALLFSWRYFEAVGALYHTLMLLFLGGMVGFALTGDLFNLFVFFELLTTAAYALTGYHIERKGPLQGALNFAVTNTIGAFLMLHGIGLLYARTGTLAFAEIGRQLAGTSPDALVVAAFALLTAGLFTKAAIVPFHFWLADAHAVASSPVSVLLSGVMIELGIYGWARVYWTSFAPVFGDQAEGLRLVLVGLGIVTAIFAGLFALAQHHLKRMLAYSSVSHSGLILIGVALLDAPGLAGAGLYTLAHGAIKGALFLLVGIVLHHHDSVDELELRGRGRGRVTAGLFVVAGLGLAGLPPFGTALGKQLVEEAAAAHGLGLAVTGTFVLASALTAGAVLRAVGRVFLGWGPREPVARERAVEDEERETEATPRRTPGVMIAPVVALLAVAVGVAVIPQVGERAGAAAELFVRTEQYAAAVMDGADVALPQPAGEIALSAKGAGLGALAALLAVALAGGALGRERMAAPLVAVGRRAVAVFEPVRALQSGHLGDYVAWMTVGLAILGGAYALVLL